MTEEQKTDWLDRWLAFRHDYPEFASEMEKLRDSRNAWREVGIFLLGLLVGASLFLFSSLPIWEIAVITIVVIFGGLAWHYYTKYD